MTVPTAPGGPGWPLSTLSLTLEYSFCSFAQISHSPIPDLPPPPISKDLATRHTILSLMYLSSRVPGALDKFGRGKFKNLSYKDPHRAGDQRVLCKAPQEKSWVCYISMEI